MSVSRSENEDFYYLVESVKVSIVLKVLGTPYFTNEVLEISCGNRHQRDAPYTTHCVVGFETEGN